MTGKLGVGVGVAAMKEVRDAQGNRDSAIAFRKLRYYLQLQRLRSLLVNCMFRDRIFLTHLLILEIKYLCANYIYSLTFLRLLKFWSHYPEMIALNLHPTFNLTEILIQLSP